MNKEEIIKAIKSLAQCQGFYGRLLENLNDEALEYLEQQNFKDTVDMVLFFEQ
jgi:hypothetical protein